jgi:hypothetical protein
LTLNLNKSTKAKHFDISQLSSEGSVEIRELLGLFTVVSSLIQALKMWLPGRFLDIKEKELPLDSRENVLQVFHSMLITSWHPVPVRFFEKGENCRL